MKLFDIRAFEITGLNRRANFGKGCLDAAQVKVFVLE
jgi:hypothetical protein